MGNLVKYEAFFGWCVQVVMEHPLLAALMILQGLTSPGIFFLCAQHIRMIAVNITTNEMINMSRYEHFWVDREGLAVGGVRRRKFRNPFDKGGVWLNCMDFWWT